MRLWVEKNDQRKEERRDKARRTGHKKRYRTPFILQVPEFVEAEGSFFVFRAKEDNALRTHGSRQPAGLSSGHRDNQLLLFLLTGIPIGDNENRKSLAANGIYSFVAVFWALPTALLGEATAAVGIALINSIGNLGRFVGPQFFDLLADLTKSTVAGTYLTAAFVLMTTILTICLPKKHEKAATGGVAPAEAPAKK